MSDELRVEIEDGKYTIVVGGGRLKLLRYGEIWDDEPLHSKMLVAIAYELDNLRKHASPPAGWREPILMALHHLQSDGALDRSMLCDLLNAAAASLPATPPEDSK